MKNRLSILAILVGAYGLVPLLFGGTPYVMNLIVAALVIGGIAIAWALLGNLGGMISFGHSAFFGVGAYVSALLTAKLGLPVLPSMLLAGAGAVVVSVAMLPALRLKGPYFALAILAYASIFRIVATVWTPVTGGAAGLPNIPGLPTVLGYDLSSLSGKYLVILTIVVAFAAVYRRISANYSGIALRAMHDSEDATRVVGVNSTLLKAMMLFISAFMTGVIGAFNTHYINFIEPDYVFHGDWVTMPIVAAIFGGYRTITGPLVGALVVYLVDQLLFKNLLPTGHQIVLGGLLVAMILTSPTGLLNMLKKKPGVAHA